MPSKTLVLYTPHEIQLRFHESKARYRVAALGRQSGKSTMATNELLKRAWENPGTKYWFISPTYDQAKIQYRRLIGTLTPCAEVMSKVNQTELRIRFTNDSVITFKSGEVAQNLRGETLHGMVLDEVRELPPDLWKMVLRPMLTTTQGWAAFLSTPNGFDAFYDLFTQATNDETGQWEAFQSPSTANPLFTQEEYQAAKAEMGEAEFDQEINANFRDLQQGSAYVGFSKANIKEFSPIIEGERLYSEYLPIILGCDFNLHPVSWHLMQQRAGDFYVFDRVFLKRSHTQEAAKVLVGKLLDLEMRAKPQVIVAGDASSKAGQRAAAGQSDYTILCQALDEAGISWSNVTPDSNPNVKDRVNTVNAKLCASDGSQHLWVHPSCKELIRDFERVVWKQNSSNFILDQVKDPMLTHSSDGVGYAIVALDPLRAQGGAGRLRIIRR